MSTNDVPGARATNRDVLGIGDWAEHDDGSLILVESAEGGRVVYSIFDVNTDPPVEYRDAMPEDGFKRRFSWQPDDPDSERWTWHDKTAFPWDRIMADFPAGQKHVSAVAQMSAAQRVAQSLDLQAETIRDRDDRPSFQRAARKIMDGFRDVLDTFRE